MSDANLLARFEQHVAGMKSSPALRMFLPESRWLRMVTISRPSSVSSWRITVSAPAGTGAPVMTRMDSPDAIGREGNAPAAIVSTTRSVGTADEDKSSLLTA